MWRKMVSQPEYTPEQAPLLPLCHVPQQPVCASGIALACAPLQQGEGGEGGGLGRAQCAGLMGSAFLTEPMAAGEPQSMQSVQHPPPGLTNGFSEPGPMLLDQPCS